MADRIRLNIPVIVEGKYDKARLAGVVNAVIIPTNGFSVFNDRAKRALYLALFLLILLVIVTRTGLWPAALVIVLAAIAGFDRRLFLKVDYALLFTFVCFFIFSGNMARIDGVRAFFAGVLEKSTLLFSALSCQVISNVPTAILLSQFTDNYRELLWGVNIGGTGTLIASLASLITFREYTRQNPGRALYYIQRFSAFNFGFLAILLIFCSLLR